MIDVKIKGLDKLARNLKRYGKAKLGKGIEKGFKKAGAMLMRESLKIVPVQTGALRASWGIRKKGSRLKTVVTIGYFGTAYGHYVHEIPNPPHAHGAEFNLKHAEEIAAAKGTWLGTAEGGMFLRKPEEQYKFLERPIRENRKEVLKIIKREVKKAK